MTATPATLVGLALTGAVRDRARALGFDRVGVGPATAPAHGAAFDAWLQAGYPVEVPAMDSMRAKQAKRRGYISFLGFRSVRASASSSIWAMRRSTLIEEV